MNFNIRQATPADFKSLAQLGRDTFYETWKDYNSEEDMKIYLAEAFDDEKIQEDISAVDCNTFFIAFVQDHPVGYAKLRRDRTYAEFSGVSAIEVERVYVRKEFQGLGPGKALMDACLELAIAEKQNWIWLGVNIDNARAIAFYKKYGFEIFGTKMFKLGTAEDQDYLMKKKLND